MAMYRHQVPQSGTHNDVQTTISPQRLGSPLVLPYNVVVPEPENWTIKALMLLNQNRRAVEELGKYCRTVIPVSSIYLGQEIVR